MDPSSKTDLNIATEIAQGKPATSSSNESMSYFPSSAFDGNPTTRWSSIFSDPQWIYVNLGAIYSISRINIKWEEASAKNYKIQVSDEAVNWTTISEQTNMPDGPRMDNFTGLSGTGQYIRMYGTSRSTVYGYSIYEFKVYGTFKSVGEAWQTRAVIMAGGQGERWGNYLSIPKHLIEIDGETILNRMVRLLKCNNVNDIVIVGPKEHDSRYNVTGTKLIASKGNCCLEYELYDNDGLDTNIIDSNKKTIILLGDVYYSESTINALVSKTTPMGFIRFSGNTKNGVVHPEFWGFSFHPNLQTKLCEHMKNIDFNGAGTGWASGVIFWDKLYKFFHFDFNEINIFIDDVTCDFDVPTEYEQWLEYRKTQVS